MAGVCSRGALLHVLKQVFPRMLAMAWSTWIEMHFSLLAGSIALSLPLQSHWDEILANGNVINTAGIGLLAGEDPYGLLKGWAALIPGKHRSLWLHLRSSGLGFPTWNSMLGLILMV